jgi:hypothetical protein
MQLLSFKAKFGGEFQNFGGQDFKASMPQYIWDLFAILWGSCMMPYEN